MSWLSSNEVEVARSKLDPVSDADWKAERDEALKQRGAAEKSWLSSLAEAIDADPDTALLYAEGVLDRMKARGDSFVKEWREILAEEPISEIAAMLRSVDPKNEQLLRNNPFIGLNRK